MSGYRCSYPLFMGISCVMLQACCIDCRSAATASATDLHGADGSQRALNRPALPASEWLSDVTPRAQILHRGDSVVGEKAAFTLPLDTAEARQSRVKGGQCSVDARAARGFRPIFTSVHHACLMRASSCLIGVTPCVPPPITPREVARVARLTLEAFLRLPGRPLNLVSYPA
jgi:hypothetical protein